jgi:isopentenyl diphosphate isomerase/L-lactate dehydrogenase-like FMN-dependent dehydrogenase
VSRDETAEGPITPDEEIVLEPADGPALERVFKLDDFETVARPKLTDDALAYIAGGAGDETTMKNNVAAFRRRKLRPRVLVDVTHVDPTTTMLGSTVSMPVGLAPTGFNRFAHPDAELPVARGAADAGVVYCLSTFSSRSLEDVAGAKGSRWFQLYVMEDRSISEGMLVRARDAGYSAVMLTVDLPVVGYRERELRAGDSLTLTQVGNFESVAAPSATLAEIVDLQLDQGLTWADVEWVQDKSGLPVVVKGILTGEDAALAAENGAAGIVVSNHGGRQLDRSPASIDVVEECVEAVGGRAEVYLDGGVRRGVDVVTALALGARAVFIGRPYLYALAAAGQSGVSHALQIVRAEIENAMALLGARTVAEIARAHVAGAEF